MEVNDIFRRATSMAFAIPRQLVDMANAGSIQNAQRAIRGTDRQRRIEDALQEVADREFPNRAR